MPEEALRLLGTAFPEAEIQYIAGLFQQRGAEQSKMAKRYKLEEKASSAAGDFLLT